MVTLFNFVSGDTGFSTEKSKNLNFFFFSITGQFPKGCYMTKSYVAAGLKLDKAASLSLKKPILVCIS